MSDKPSGTAQAAASQLARNTQEPFAWAIEVSRDVWSLTHMPHIARGWPQADVVPLYRSPTLTDAEREAVDMAIDLLNGVEDVSAGASRRADAAAATLRGLLERTK